MTMTSRATALLVLAAAASLPAAAHAQWIHTPSNNQPAPLYPYAVQQNQPYAVQVAPGTYVIHRPEDAAPQPHRHHRPASARPRSNPALVAELNNRHKPNRAKTAALETTQVVRDKPVVRETKRYVDDPPRIVERYVDGNGKPLRIKPSQVTINAPVLDKPQGKDDVKRVINAEAEITIIGPDRMNIRLYRKGGKPAAD